MEQTSEKMKIQVSPTTQRMLLDAPTHDFALEDRRDDSGELGVEVKGKGRQYTSWVHSASLAKKPDSASETEPLAGRDPEEGLGK